MLNSIKNELGKSPKWRSLLWRALMAMEVTLENLPFTAVPNQITVVAKSKKLIFHDHGWNWDVSGKNGFYMPFAFKGP